MKNPFKRSDTVLRIEEWNARFPFDYIWRKKYNIPFGSPQHLQMDLFDIKFDIEEQNYIEYIVSVKKYGNQDDQQLLKSKVNEESEKSQNEKDFDELDLDEFNDLKV